MPVIGIDPGSEKSAYVGIDGPHIISTGYKPNPWVLERVTKSGCTIVVEDITVRGRMSTHAIKTAQWAAAFVTRACGTLDFEHLLSREKILHYVTGNGNASKAAVKKMMMHEFFGGRTTGAFQDWNYHIWDALAVAWVYSNMESRRRE